MTGLRVAETFGPTFQGEGPSAGRVAAFVRLWGCNLDCSWCDTPYTWDTTGKLGRAYDRGAESADVPLDDLWADLADVVAGADLLVVTGGEPLVQSAGVADLAGLALEAGMAVEVETNGTLPPPLDAAGLAYNVSPKLDHAATTKPALRPARLAAFRDLADSAVRWKFVCAEPADLCDVELLTSTLDLDPADVWVMPEGRTAEKVLAGARALAEPTLNLGFNLSMRVHVLLWHDERGR